MDVLRSSCWQKHQFYLMLQRSGIQLISPHITDVTITQALSQYMVPYMHSDPLSSVCILV
uniref:Uncharacterized protein n=1 Tax=Arundo donax TaxID=35708 RepID=A0A0A9B8N3_ARUDO